MHSQELRGFVGIAFRVSEDESRFECFYLRPKNGRSEDQLQRNHSAPYMSIPGFPWQKLRSEYPDKCGARVDLIPGEWTKVRIQVKDRTARLYVNGSEQPTLIVNDLKQPSARGGIGFWIGPGTIAHFTNLKLTPLSRHPLNSFRKTVSNLVGSFRPSSSAFVFLRIMQTGEEPVKVALRLASLDL